MTDELIRWDTPTPPDIKTLAWRPVGKRPGQEKTVQELDKPLMTSELVIPRRMTDSPGQVFTTIDLSSCRGLFFFYDDQKRFMGLFSYEGQEDGTWSFPLEFNFPDVQVIYLPLGVDDEIEELSCRGILNMFSLAMESYHTVDFRVCLCPLSSHVPS